MSVLILYWVILFTTYFAASKLRQHRERFSFLPHITMGIVYAIVLVMGLRMGVNEQVIGQLRSIGFQALVITIACVSGSMFAVFGTRKLMGMNRFGDLQGCAAENPSAEERAQNSVQRAEMENELKSTLTILAFVVLGVLLGLFVLRRQSIDFLTAFDSFSGTATSVLLYIMVALVGFDLGLSGKVAACFKAVGIRAFAFPLAAIIGTLVMGALSGRLLGFSAREGLAISAGFGWYTYAPAVIANAGPEYAVASAVAFLYNMIRETASIVLIPVAARRIGYLEAVSMPGISSMDICMPIIERSCRQDTVLYAFLIGFMMNIVTSVGVPLIMRI